MNVLIHKISVLYDLSYATRGKSGIPGDTRSIAGMLGNNTQIDSSFILFPKTFVRNPIRKRKTILFSHRYLGKSIRENSGRTLLPGALEKILLLLQTLNIRKKVNCVEISEPTAAKTFDLLGLKFDNSIHIPKLLIATISTPSLFLRPLRLGLYKLKIKNYDFYIQQQIDPIQVPKKIKHIVRIHDILPITHPEYFDDVAVDVFSRGLETMLSNPKINWVFDTKASANEFEKIFGIKAHAIPCEVGAHLPKLQVNPSKKLQVALINTIEPRKQVAMVLEGFKKYLESSNSSAKLKLIIMGSKGWQEEALWEKLKGCVPGSEIEFYANPSNEFVSDILYESMFILSASAAEGFGLPPLEGALLGCKPIVSNIPQHVETLGEHAIYFEPKDQVSLVEALFRAEDVSKSFSTSDSDHLSKYVETHYERSEVSRQWLALLNKLKNN